MLIAGLIDRREFLRIGRHSHHHGSHFQIKVPGLGTLQRLGWALRYGLNNRSSVAALAASML